MDTKGSKSTIPPSFEGSTARSDLLRTEAWYALNDWPYNSPGTAIQVGSLRGLPLKTAIVL